MKKSYLITWLGALSTLLITTFSISQKTKKFGQKIHPKGKMSFSDIINKLRNFNNSGMIDKGIDLVLKKSAKQR